MPAGCTRHDTQEAKTDWGKFYGEARLKKDTHDKSAIEMAERGFRETAGLSPVLNYRFRLLKANLASCTMPKDALRLMAVEPPESPVAAELEAERKLVEAVAQGCSGDLLQAKVLLANARQRASQVQPALLANIANAEGWLAGQSSDQDEQQRDFQTAVDLARKYRNPVEASALNSLGQLLIQRKQYDRATEEFSSALDAARLWHDSLLEEKALGNLGFSYSQLGDWKRAVSFSQQAESLAAEIKNNPDRAKWLIDLGREHFSQLEYVEAEESYLKALVILQELQDHDGQANALHHLAQLALKMRDGKKAEDYASQEDALHPEGERHLELLLDKAEIAMARRDFATAEELLQEILRRPNVKPVFRWRAQSDLAGIYFAQKQISEAESAFREGINMVEGMRCKIPEEQRMSFLDEAPFYDYYVRFLVAQNKTTEALAFAEHGRSPTLAEALGIPCGTRNEKQNFASLQAMLKKRHQVALAYWLAEEESYLWAITPTGITLFHLRPEMEIKKLVEDYAAQIADRREIEESPAGRKLYDMLVGPAKELISKAPSVVIVPHRSLYNLSFEALIVPAVKPDAKPHYWIEDVGVETASFLGLLAKPGPPRAGRSKDLFLMGAPVEASTDFPVLEHASEEMNKLAARFPAPGMAVIAGKDATPEAYASSHPGDFRLIHFVTHGTASMERPLDSAIILSPGPNKSYKLYARGIKDVKLHADLVTISACSGAGKRQYSGEGLVGLAWAFMRAGAHQVVAALWEVDDASSPQLMDDFYGELSKGKSAASALRHAKLNMLHSPDFHRRPFYWASLQVYTGG